MAKKEIEKKEEVTKKVKAPKEQKKVEKEGLLTKLKNFISGVKTEAKRVKWPKRKDKEKNSLATIIFIVGCSLFFYAIDIIMAFLHTLGR